jgi:hypothetical protein
MQLELIDTLVWIFLVMLPWFVGWTVICNIVFMTFKKWLWDIIE